MPDCSKQILLASRRFFNTKHFPLVEAATRSYVRGNYNEALTYLSQLPDDKDLLTGLIEKVKGKSVYSNLKKLNRNECVDKKDAVIAVSSLLTHAIIESKINSEYWSLAPDLINKLRELTQ